MIKNNIYILFLSLVFLAGCGGGLSEKEKNEIEGFEEEWDANIQMGMYLAAKLSEAENLITVPADTLKTDSLPVYPDMEKAAKYHPEIKKIKTGYNEITTKQSEEYKNWMEFKNKAMKDELSYEEVKDKIKTQREKLLKIQSEFSKKIKSIEKIISELNS